MSDETTIASPAASTTAATPAGTPPAPAASPPTPAGAGTFAWPDDLKPTATAKGWDKFPSGDAAAVDVMRNYLKAEKLLGVPPERLLRLPDPGASEDAWNSAYGALGRPETPEGYQVAKPADLPDNYPYDENLIKTRLPLFHKLGFTQRQVEALNTELHAANVQALREHEAQMVQRATAAEAELRKAWGPQYDTNMALSERVISRFGGQEFRDWLGQYGFDKDAAFRTMFASIGRAIGEDGAGASATSSAASATAEIDRLIADNAFQAKLMGRDGLEAKKQAQQQWSEVIARAAASG